MRTLSAEATKATEVNYYPLLNLSRKRVQEVRISAKCATKGHPLQTLNTIAQY